LDEDIPWSGVGGVGIGTSVNGSCSQKREKGSDGEHYFTRRGGARACYPKRTVALSIFEVSFSPLEKLTLENDQGAKVKAKALRSDWKNK
jgi:hypothetical protein